MDKRFTATRHDNNKKKTLFIQNSSNQRSIKQKGTPCEYLDNEAQREAMNLILFLSYHHHITQNDAKTALCCRYTPLPKKQIVKTRESRDYAGSPNPSQKSGLICTKFEWKGSARTPQDSPAGWHNARQ